MKTESQARRKRGRKIPCLGSTTFIWTFYLFFLQALGKCFNCKFSIVQKMYLPCAADYITPYLGTDYDQRKYSPVALLPCHIHASYPTAFSLLTLREKVGCTCSPEGPGFWDMEVKHSPMCKSCICNPGTWCMTEEITPACWQDLQQSSAPCPIWSISHALTLPESKQVT